MVVTTSAVYATGAVQVCLTKVVPVTARAGAAAAACRVRDDDKWVPGQSVQMAVGGYHWPGQQGVGLQMHHCKEALPEVCRRALA